MDDSRTCGHVTAHPGDVRDGPVFLVLVSWLRRCAHPACGVGLECRKWLAQAVGPFGTALAAFRQETPPMNRQARSPVPLRILMPTGRALSPSSRHPRFASRCRAVWSPKKCSVQRETVLERLAADARRPCWSWARRGPADCVPCSLFTWAVSWSVSWMSAIRSSGLLLCPLAREASVPGFRLRLCASLPRAVRPWARSTFFLSAPDLELRFLQVRLCVASGRPMVLIPAFAICAWRSLLSMLVSRAPVPVFVIACSFATCCLSSLPVVGVGAVSPVGPVGPGGCTLALRAVPPAPARVLLFQLAALGSAGSSCS